MTKHEMPTLGEMIDEAYRVREVRLRAAKEVDRLKELENNLTAEILARLGEEGLTGSRGEVATAGVKNEDVPAPRDWDKIRDYVVENDAWDMMEKRLSARACRDRIEGGEELPGIEMIPIKKLSLTKASR